MVWLLDQTGAYMQLGNERRYEDETFYFEGQGLDEELVVDAASLPEAYPEVVVLEGGSAVAAYTTAEGEQGTTYTQGNDIWNNGIFPGSRVERIQTGQGQPSFTWEGKKEQELLIYYFDEDAARDTYEPTEGDKFILKSRGFGETEERVHPAMEPLPELPNGSWIIEGVITEDNKLLTFGQVGHRQLVEWCVALRLMESTADYHNLNVSSARSISILGFFSVNRVVQTYLDELRERTGEDFTPTEEPREKAERVGIPMGLSDEQWARYYE